MDDISGHLFNLIIFIKCITLRPQDGTITMLDTGIVGSYSKQHIHLVPWHSFPSYGLLCKNTFMKMTRLRQCLEYFSITQTKWWKFFTWSTPIGCIVSVQVNEPSVGKWACCSASLDLVHSTPDTLGLTHSTSNFPDVLNIESCDFL